MRKKSNDLVYNPVVRLRSARKKACEMASTEAKSVSATAKQLYESRLRTVLEKSDLGRFVSIEPESGDYFLGDTLDDAVNGALEKYPERLTHTIRIGHLAGLHLGMITK